jgi:uncharacterized Zn-finger protein
MSASPVSPHHSAPHDQIQVHPDTEQVACDGGGGALGHPLVWYQFERRDQITCAYCGRVFLRQPRG